MKRMQAEKAAKKMVLSGYRHHSYEQEKWFLDHFFKDNTSEIDYKYLIPDTYPDILGPQRLRAAKNGVICLLTLVSRAAIDHGMDPELSFALSDYYVNMAESQDREEQLEELVVNIVSHYRDLVRQAQIQRYSRTVVRAIRYISRCIYEPCTVVDVAAYVGLHPNYFSQVFKGEIGIPPSRYIQKQKMEEAVKMLDSGYTVSETADALSFCDIAYFSNMFKQYYSKTPSEYVRKWVERR